MNIEIEDVLKTPVREHTRWVHGFLVKVRASVRRHLHKFSKFTPSPDQHEMEFPFALPHRPLQIRASSKNSKMTNSDQLEFDF